MAEAAPGRECEVVWDEPEALERELGRLRAGDVIVMFYEKLEPLLAVLSRHGATPISSIEGLAAYAAAASTRPLEVPPAVAPTAPSVTALSAAPQRAPFVPRREPLAVTGQLPGWR